MIPNGVHENVREDKRKALIPRRCFTEESERSITELYMSESNITMRRLAKEYGCHHSIIWRILNKRIPKKILMQRRKGVGLPKFSQNVEQEMVSKYLNNHDVTIKELAEEYNCVPETITRILRKNGITRNFIMKRAVKVTASKRLRHIPKMLRF
ncbi:MAG: hypothetical protein QXZ17_09360 [Nitrososphaerota archaeon]